MSISTESTPACISKAHPLALIPVFWEPAQTCTLCEGLRKTQDEEREALDLKRWAFSPVVNWETNMESRLHKNGRVITDIDVNLKHLLIPSEMGLPWWAQTGSESACNVGELVLIHALGRSLAIRSSILACRIPWTEKRGKLQSMELQRTGHDWATNAFHLFPL